MRHIKIPGVTDQTTDFHIPYQLYCSELVLPGTAGKGKLQFFDSSRAATTSTLEFDIFDAANCNCVLPTELVRCFWDVALGAMVPMGSQGLVRMGKPTANIAAGASGTVRIWPTSVAESSPNIDIEGVELLWGDNGTQVSSGKETRIRYYSYDSIWRFVGGDCE